MVPLVAVLLFQPAVYKDQVRPIRHLRNPHTRRQTTAGERLKALIWCCTKLRHAWLHAGEMGHTMGHTLGHTRSKAPRGTLGTTWRGASMRGYRYRALRSCLRGRPAPALGAQLTAFYPVKGVENATSRTLLIMFNNQSLIISTCRSNGGSRAIQEGSSSMRPSDRFMEISGPWMALACKVSQRCRLDTHGARCI